MTADATGPIEEDTFGLPIGPVLRQVGPGRPGIDLGEHSTPLAADNYFAGNLLTLWHAVSEAGGAVGFVPPVSRTEIAPAAAALVQAIRDGLVLPLVVTQGRELVGAAFLQPNRLGLSAHTGEITKVMVAPALQGSGLGRMLLTGLLDLAGSTGLERVELTVRDGSGADAFYRRFGFTEYGRRPGWLRIAPGEDRDEILMWAPVPPRGTA